MAVPDSAGRVRPEDILDEPRRSQFLAVAGRVDPLAQGGVLPRCYYLVDQTEEPRLRELLLSTGMAVPVLEEDIPRTAGDRLLLSGLVGVPHKDWCDRLIVDRRPPNSCEFRLGWAQLPHGSQLVWLVLDRRSSVRASGGDVRT